jgi:methyl-accepting chemotaxis protein
MIEKLSFNRKIRATLKAAVQLQATQLDQMTQQNAALVERSAAAAESLKDQAASLSHAVSTVKMS